MPDTPVNHFPLELADLCVKCGLCLPHCPTYQLTENEAESPRGRIALMQGLATGLLENSPVLESHLDKCLTCRACEVVCPADVPYGELIDQGRAMVRASHPQSYASRTRLLPWLLTNRTAHRVMGILLRLYQRLGLQWLVRRSHLLGNGRLARLESFLPWIPGAKKPCSQTTHTSPARGRVALFTGCVSQWLENDVLEDAAVLLNACGFDVEIPQAQGCCGALARHQGDLTGSKRLAGNNIKAFSGEYQAIIGIASGCTSMLAEYSLLSENGESVSAKTQDISHFLQQHWPDELMLNAMHQQVAIHDPCSLRNVLKQAQAPYALLNKIPGIEVTALNDNATCCGAAGKYFIDQPEMSDQLGLKKAAAVCEQLPDIVVTSNVGCGMQLKKQLRQAGINTPVLHPISLLRRQLPVKG